MAFSKFVLTATTSDLLTEVGEAIETVLTWVGKVITSLTGGELQPLLPLLAVGIAISAVMLGIKVIKGTIWGC